MSYNGHPTWNAWNVSLWISNDERLYAAAVDACRRYKSSRVRAGAFYVATGLTVESKTPDGARYSYSCVDHALRNLDIAYEGRKS